MSPEVIGKPDGREVALLRTASDNGTMSDPWFFPMVPGSAEGDDDVIMTHVFRHWYISPDGTKNEREREFKIVFVNENQSLVRALDSVVRHQLRLDMPPPAPKLLPPKLQVPTPKLQVPTPKPLPPNLVLYISQPHPCDCGTLCGEAASVLLHRIDESIAQKSPCTSLQANYRIQACLPHVTAADAKSQLENVTQGADGRVCALRVINTTTKKWSHPPVNQKHAIGMVAMQGPQDMYECITIRPKLAFPLPPSFKSEISVALELLDDVTRLALLLIARRAQEPARGELKILEGWLQENTNKLTSSTGHQVLKRQMQQTIPFKGRYHDWKTLQAASLIFGSRCVIFSLDPWVMPDVIGTPQSDKQPDIFVLKLPSSDSAPTRYLPIIPISEHSPTPQFAACTKIPLDLCGIQSDGNPSITRQVRFSFSNRFSFCDCVSICSYNLYIHVLYICSIIFIYFFVLFLKEFWLVAVPEDDSLLRSLDILGAYHALCPFRAGHLSTSTETCVFFFLLFCLLFLFF
jgi:hypothetical protein